MYVIRKFAIFDKISILKRKHFNLLKFDTYLDYIHKSSSYLTKISLYLIKTEELMLLQEMLMLFILRSLQNA
jgi:hypothetical protein